MGFSFGDCDGADEDQDCDAVAVTFGVILMALLWDLRVRGREEGVRLGNSDHAALRAADSYPSMYWVPQ